MKIKPLKHSGDSANIAYYGEPGSERPGRFWVQVLRNDIRYNGKTREITRMRPPDFSITVYCTGKGEVARFQYKPKRANAGALPASTVTRLVRAHEV